MRIKNLPSIESMDGSQDALIIEQTDGSEDKSRKVSPAQIKQYVLGNSIDDIYSVMGQNGAKNLIPYPYYHTSKTTAGITVTDNGDGTLTFDGTSTSSAVIFRLTNNDTNIKIPLNKDKYILTWVDSSEHKRYFRIDIALVKSDETTIVVNGELGVINIDNTNGEYKGIYAVTVWSGNNRTVSNLTFKPMLRLAADTDNTYQPYAKTNRQLTEAIGDLSQTGLTGDSVAEQLGDVIASNALKVVTKDSVSSNTTKSFDMGNTPGVYLVVVGQGGSWDLLGMYLIKITRYASGTNVKTIVSPVNYPPTVTASEISSQNGKITIASSTAGVTLSIYQFNLDIA